MRWVRLISFTFIAFWCVPIYAQDFDRLESCGTEEVTVSTAAVGLDPSGTCSLSRIHQITKAICSVSGANVRMRIDGTNPDTNTGHVVEDGSYIYLNNPGEIDNASFIRDDSTDAELTCSYRRVGG